MNGLWGETVRLASLVPSEWTAWALAMLPIYARIQAILMVFPVFSERSLGVRVRVSLALSLTPLMAPQILPQYEEVMPFAVAMGREILIGLIVAMPVRLIAFALGVAATAIASTASLSQILGFGNEAAPHPIGNFLHWAGLALLLALGLPVMVVAFIAHSFEVLPPGEWPEAQTIVPGIWAYANQSFVLAMLLASPFILGGLLYQALLGVINKVMPSLPVVFIGAPAAILLALIGLLLTAPLLLERWAMAILDMRVLE